MKSFDIEISDLEFLEEQIATPIVRIVRYESSTATPIYGFTKPDDGAVVELGKLGTFNLLDKNSPWYQFVPRNPDGKINVTSPLGLRNVSGLFNNITSPDRYGWGAVNRPFLRLSNSDYSDYLPQAITNRAFYNQVKTSVVPGANQAAVDGLAGKLWRDLSLADRQLVQNSNWQQTIDSTGKVDNSQRYANPFLTVSDYAPRAISQLTSSANGDKSALARIEAATPGTITDVTTFTKQDAKGNSTVTEKFQRNLNTEKGGTSLSGWNVIFGQWLDHGLGSIGKGGNKLTANGAGSQIIIPLAPDDPLYAVTQPNADGIRALSIARATVANPEQAGADGKFGTADDLSDPGIDRKYGTADDIFGTANPEYNNRVSPYIDQSQTYGSSDDVTNLLREWKLDPSTGKYAPGMRLLDGNSLASPWQRTNPDGSVILTQRTLPTLNELRADLRQTGRADLTWEDISNFRVRDERGQVLDLDGDARNGIQAKFTDNTLVADMLPRLDLAHLNAAGLVDFKTLFPSFSGQIADYVNVNSGQPTTLGLANVDLVNEMLLRSIGDHYMSGDGRLNENFGLTAMHHVWQQEHNWQIDNLIHTISQGQAADPTKAFAHSWQSPVMATAAPNPGIRIVNGHYQDANGNYTDRAGNVNWNQEKMFQSAVLITQTEYQHIAISEYARTMSPNIPEFMVYNPTVNADTSLEYSQVAYRFGHSQLRETIDILDPNGSLSGLVTKYALEQAFLTPAQYAAIGPTAIAQGMTRQFSSEIDEIITPTLQQALLGQPQDLAAINIARGRDLGLPTLNTLRRNLYANFESTLTDLRQQGGNSSGNQLQGTMARTHDQQLGLKPYTSWADFGKNLLHPAALTNFIAAYATNGNLDLASAIVKLGRGDKLGSLTAGEVTAYQNIGWKDANAQANAKNFLGDSASADKSFEYIDAWIGGLAEKHVPNGQLGATFDAIFVEQMTRSMNGDRFYYLWRLQFGLPEFTQLSSAVRGEQFKDIVERNTGATHLTGKVFFATDSHLELGEDPTLSKNNNATPDAAGHRYGDRVAALGIGVYSSGGDNISTNGTVIQIRSSEFGGIDRRYINDVRPDSSKIDPKAVNPDGTPKFGFNSHETIGGTKFADYIAGGNGDDTIYGDDGNDILLGNNGGDHLYAENGDDYIDGGAGDDHLDGGDGNDRIYGGDGSDVLIGGNGNDALFGGAGVDRIQGNNGDDYIDGGDDDDIIDSGAGNDILIGGAGNDILIGGDGNDTYVFNAGFGRDILRENGSSGSLDTVKFGIGLTLDKFEINRRGTDLVLKVIKTNDILTIVGQFDLADRAAIEQFQFDNGAITLTKDAMISYSTNLAVTDPNSSGAGNNTIVPDTNGRGSGGDRNDKSGNDTLFPDTNGRASGGDGNDKLFVGTGGGNTLYGSAGVDRFWIANAELPATANTIVNFQVGTDIIGIQGAKSLGISAITLKLNQVGADTAINFGSKTLAILTGIQATSLSPGNASQFVFA